MLYEVITVDSIPINPAELRVDTYRASGAGDVGERLPCLLAVETPGVTVADTENAALLVQRAATHPPEIAHDQGKP